MRSRLRRIAKWSGLVACVLIALVFCVSLWRPVMWEREDGRLTLDLECGMIGATWRPSNWIGQAHAPGFIVGVYPRSPLPPAWSIVRGDQPGFGHYEFVPLWMPLVALTTITGWLWRRD